MQEAREGKLEESSFGSPALVLLYAASHFSLSPTARPFQLGAISSLTLVDDTPQDHPAWDVPWRSHPPQGSTRDLPTREATPNHHNTSDDDGVSTDTSIPERTLAGGVGVEEVEVARVVVTPMKLASLEEGKRKRMDFLVRSKHQNLVVRRVIRMMWPTPLGSGSVVSPTTVTIMSIYTSCL